MLLIVATAVAVAVERLRLPAVLGFLLAGIVIGPEGLGLLSNAERIYLLAELGVVLLMLTIGLEFSFERLRGVRSVAAVGGSLQILLSVAVGMGFAFLRGWTPYQGFFLGAVIALSSTSIVLKHLLDRGELDSEHGKASVAILVFQDLAVVPLMVLLTALGDPAGSVACAVGASLLKAGLLLAAAVLFARYLLPGFLRRMAFVRSREVMFLAMVVLTLGAAWVTGRLGLSLGVGAFFAGLMFANTDYGHDLIGQIAPFRHVFVSLFFVSIGLLFNISFALENAWVVAAVVGLVLAVNFLVTAALLLGFGYPPRVALAAGLILAQIGEFSFLLLEAGRKAEVVGPFFYQLLLSAAFITMLLTPLLFRMVPAILAWAERVPFFGMPPGRRSQPASGTRALRNHVILCGFGPAGRDLALALRAERIPCVIIELNPKSIRQARCLGLEALYGDAANEAVLRKAGIARARTVAVSFGDPIGMAQIVQIVERLNPEVELVVRTRFEREVPRLYGMGADYVVMEELEASREMSRVVLTELGVHPEKIEGHLAKIRSRKELLIEQKILNAQKPEGRVE